MIPSPPNNIAHCRWFLVSASILVLAVSAFGCDRAVDWSNATLTESSRADTSCVDEISEAVAQIYSDSGLLDVEMDDDDIDTLVNQGTVDEQVVLYGGDEIRHWSIAALDEGADCAVYNYGVTGIDLQTNELDEAMTPRTVDGSGKDEALVPLRQCHCD